MNPGMFKEWVAQGLKKEGKTQDGLADVIGVDRSVISKIINGRRQLKANELERVARYIGEPVPDRIMPIRYTIGAGQEVFAVDDDGEIEYASFSGMWGVEAEVAIVRGDSMWPVFNDGNKVIFGPARPPNSTDNRRMRIVRLADDRLMIKVMRKTNDPAFWTLESFNAPPLEDRVVTTVAEILRVDYL